MSPKLSVGIFAPTPLFSQDLLEALRHQGYAIQQCTTIEAFQQFLKAAKQTLDCLILALPSGSAAAELAAIATWLHGQAILLPAIIIKSTPSNESGPSVARSPTPGSPSETALAPTFVYHTAEWVATITDIATFERATKQAIAQFIDLSPTCWSKHYSYGSATELLDNLPASQQQQLIEKLKERLGYLGVYYKRDPQNFFRHLSGQAKEDLLNDLRESYREIVLNYFQNDGTLNQRIDDFVNMAFFSDISVSQIVEIHMDLMDDFSNQLKLEGRSEEILLDYRLTLIDTIAHLCEMYRRSIPRQS